MSILETRKLPGPFGVRVTGLDLSDTPEPALLHALADALCEEKIIVIPGQRLSNDEYVAFGRLWGDPILVYKKDHRHASHPEMIRQGNSSATPEYIRNAANHWHSDSTYERVAATTTMIFGVESPLTGGETLFTDMVSAYADLPPDRRARIGDLRVNHRASGGVAANDETILKFDGITPEQRATFVPLEDVTHPLVLNHPVTKRNALYGVSGSAYGIEGLAPAEGVALLAELKTHATQPRYRQSYRLLPGDVLLWDNLSVMHRATPIEYSDEDGKRRLNFRISVRGYPAGLTRRNP